MFVPVDRNIGQGRLPMKVPNTAINNAPIRTGHTDDARPAQIGSTCDRLFVLIPLYCTGHLDLTQSRGTRQHQSGTMRGGTYCRERNTAMAKLRIPSSLDTRQHRVPLLPVNDIYNQCTSCSRIRAASICVEELPRSNF